MSNEVINQTPSIERAKELEQQAKEGLNQMTLGQNKVINACHKMRDTKAYTALGFDTYYAWGESSLNLKKSRLNELAVAGEVQQELLIGVEKQAKPIERIAVMEKDDSVENEVANIHDNPDHEAIITDKSTVTVSDLSDISTPQLVALAKAPKGQRLAILDGVVDEAKQEDKPITTLIIKEAVKASAESIQSIEPTENEKAQAIKKQHKSAMGKVSLLTEILNGLDTAKVDSEEAENWKLYLDEVKLSISTLEKQLGYE